MGEVISQADFARCAGVSGAAVSRALAAGRLVTTDAGLDIDDGANTIYLDEHQEQAVQKMEETCEVLPGWAAMSVKIPGRAPTAVCFLPPFGKNSIPSSVDFGGWTFSVAPHSATDPDGKQYKIICVTHKGARPPWLEEDASKAPQGKGKPAKARA